MDFAACIRFHPSRGGMDKRGGIWSGATVTCISRAEVKLKMKIDELHGTVAPRDNEWSYWTGTRTSLMIHHAHPRKYPRKYQADAPISFVHVCLIGIGPSRSAFPSFWAVVRLVLQTYLGKRKL